MSIRATTEPVIHGDRFFIGGEWVGPSSDAIIDVIDSGTEELYYTIASAGPPDVSRAVAAARHAFDEGPWSRLTHAERAAYLRALGAGLQERNDVLGQLWPRESGALYKVAQFAAPSSRGTHLRRLSVTRSVLRFSRAARSCSSRLRKRPARATCSRRWRSRSACRPAS